MAVTAHTFPSYYQALGTKKINLTSDTLQVLLVASGVYAWNSTAQAAVTVHDFLTANGTLTEVSTSGTAYTRLSLSGVTYTTTGLVTTLTCTSPSWGSSTIAAEYALFFDNTVGGSDTTNQVICYWDFGGTDSSSAGIFSLNVNGSGLDIITAS